MEEEEGGWRRRGDGGGGGMEEGGWRRKGRWREEELHIFMRGNLVSLTREVFLVSLGEEGGGRG